MNATQNTLKTERLIRMGLLAEPAGYVDGMNLYEFVTSNPVNLVDPLGLKAEDPATNPENTPRPPGHPGPWPGEYEPPAPVKNPVVVGTIVEPVGKDPNRLRITCKVGCEGEDGPYEGIFDVTSEGDDVRAEFPVQRTHEDRPINACVGGILKVNVRIRGNRPGKVILTPRDGGKPIELPINAPPPRVPSFDIDRIGGSTPRPQRPR